MLQLHLLTLLLRKRKGKDQFEHTEYTLIREVKYDFSFRRASR